MPGTMDRRNFLKLIGVATAAAGTAAAARTAPALAQAAPSASGKGPFAIMADLSRCDGCAAKGTPACVAACRAEHASDFPQVEGEVPVNWPTGKKDDWRDRRDATDTLTPYNWTFVQKARVEHEGGTTELSIPRHCMHCDNPTCANLCPFGVIERKESGAVCIDEEHCMGGAKCKSVCPWGIPQRQGGVGIYMELAPGYVGGGAMFKCDLCADRLEKGQPPACVEACQAEKGKDAALSFGPREEIRDRARRLARETGAHLYGAEENGGTGMIYLSPIPFEKVDAALHRDGKQKFFLPTRPEPMREANLIAGAAVVAPFAAFSSALIAGKKAVQRALGRKAAHPEPPIVPATPADGEVKP